MFSGDCSDSLPRQAHDTMTKQKIFTKTVILVSFISLFTDIASEMLYPVMPVYLQTIGFSVIIIGVLEGLAEAIAGLSKGYFGKLSDARSRRVPFIRWGYALSAISKPMLAAFTFPAWIFFARTLDRFGKGIRTSARDALLSDESIPENKGKIFGFHRSMDTAGAAIGPVAALAFLYFLPGNYQWLFILSVIPGLVAISLTFFLKDKISKPAGQKKNINFFSYFSYWKQSSPGYKKLVTGLLAFTLFNSSDVFLLLMLKYRGFSDLHVIGFYIFYNITYAALSYPAGHIADKIGMKKVLVSGLIIFATVYFFMGMASSEWQFLFLFILYSFYAASTEGISKAWISNISNKNETATAIGLYNSLASIFALLASSIAGVIWHFFSPVLMFSISGIAVILISCYLALVKIENISIIRKNL